MCVISSPSHRLYDQNLRGTKDAFVVNQFNKFWFWSFFVQAFLHKCQQNARQYCTLHQLGFKLRGLLLSSICICVFFGLLLTLYLRSPDSDCVKCYCGSLGSQEKNVGFSEVDTWRRGQTADLETDFSAKKSLPWRSEQFHTSLKKKKKN